MKRRYMLYLLGLVLLSGCVVRTYPVTKDRLDQELTAGNRGYLKGVGPSREVKERKSTRTTHVVEIELHSPIRFEKMPKVKLGEAPIEKIEIEKSQDQDLWGNRGFITQESLQPTYAVEKSVEKYKVEKGDTLQKISQKFYGTTKKWTKIYNANKATLKGPNKIYPGQVIDIPTEPLKETPENLK